MPVCGNILVDDIVQTVLWLTDAVVVAFPHLTGISGYDVFCDGTNLYRIVVAWLVTEMVLKEHGKIADVGF